MKKVQLLLVATLFVTQLLAQNVGISETAITPNNNAILELQSNIRGFLPPRLTSDERNTLTAKLTPAEEGLEIYNKSRKCKEFWTGTQWSSSDPSGTIKPFAGKVLPDGWLWCDGSEVSRETYKDLWNAIIVYWGQGNNATTFNLPDLRGNFLRGVDNMNNTVGVGGGVAGNDPDAGSRIAKYTGGNTGNEVGSYQGDAFQGHKHNSNGHAHSNNLINIVLFQMLEQVEVQV